MRQSISKLFKKMSKQEESISQENMNDTSKSDEQITETGASTADPDNFVQESDESSDVDSWQKKYNEMNDKYLRLYSEFDNYRKRSARERIEFTKTASADIFSAILPILDDFDRAAKALEQSSEIETVKEGMSLIHNKLWNTLHQKGLEPLDAIGKEFDSELFEAITSYPATEPDMKGKVIDVLEKGYTLNGKVIRFAKVVVGS
jgi:molecular chaperone GrpE